MYCVCVFAGQDCGAAEPVLARVVRGDHLQRDVPAHVHQAQAGAQGQALADVSYHRHLLHRHERNLLRAGGTGFVNTVPQP